MATPERLNSILRQRPVPGHLQAHVGEDLDIPLPRVPLTAETQSVELSASIDNPGTLEILDSPGTLEGALLPRTLHARGTRPGRTVISVRVVDPLSGEAIVGVDPVEIIIDIDSGDR